MNIENLLISLIKMLKDKANIDATYVNDKNFPGGFYLNFTEFNTAVLRVNKDGKFSMRAVELNGDAFRYGFSYKFLIPTDESVKKIEATLEKVHIDGNKELHKVIFPLFCYLNVLYQFYKRSLSSKKRWFEKYKEIEKRKFDKVRYICSNLSSRQALKLLDKEEQLKILS